MAPAGAPPQGDVALTKLTDVGNRWSGWVSVDGKPVEVYKVKHKERKTTCYIEAVEGKEFTVAFTRATQGGTDISAWLRVDGTSIEGYAIPITAQVGKVDTFAGVRISAFAIRPFKFAQIALTDDPDEANNSEQVVKNLGTIQLEIYRTTITGEARARTDPYQDVKQHFVDERSKKATMSHSTAYGDAKPSVETGRITVCYDIDPNGSPGYVLEFKYRSRTLLELEDIIKRTSLGNSCPRIETSPSPARGPSASASASGSGSPATNRKKRKSSAVLLSDNEEEDLHAKIARLEAENSQLKGAVKREKGEVKPKVKGKPIGKVSTENGRTVLDLLDEDDD